MSGSECKRAGTSLTVGGLRPAQDAVTYLSSLGPHGVRLGLHRIERALAALGRPEQGLRILLVAGTNGKGSTCALAASALRAAGYHVGLYTSPHLHRFHERIQVDSRPVSDEELADLLEAVRRACPWQDDAGAERLTYFECATVLGLLCFARRGVDVAVIETGLGGQLDATAVVRPCVIAMTRIGLDHRDYFGDSIGAVARAEASIVKPDVPVVVAPCQRPRALDVLRAEMRRRGASVSVCVDRYTGPLSLRGGHQRENAAVAKAALAQLRPHGLHVREDVLAAAFASTQWPGRLEELDGVVLDVAHNADGARALAGALRELHPNGRVELVFGVMADKDYRQMLRILASRVRRVHVCPALTPRSLTPALCVAAATDVGLSCVLHATCDEALNAARRAAGPDGLVCVTGSFSVVAEVRRILLGERVSRE